MWTDAAGTVHGPAGEDARIACLVPSLTELCIDLGLADRLVARTQYCVHPAKVVADIPAIGGTKKVSLPKLEALRPTHAILNIDENTREMAGEIAAFVPHVIVTHPLAPDDNLALFELIGGVFGTADRAAELAAGYHAARARLAAEDLLPRQVVYFIWREPWMTVSRDTYISALLAAANWQTALHDPAVRYPEVTVTPALVAATDLFLFSSEPYAFTESHLDDFARAYDCPRDKLMLVDGEYCSWYGSRAIAGLNYMRRLARQIS